jgi:23S rRNA pseudouridine1911/1915/1917 synthase
MATDLSILFEDNHVLAVVKPAPLLTQAPPDVPSLEGLAKAYLKEKYGKPGNVYLGIPHRLDRPVSGVVIFARNTKAAQRLAEQFQSRKVEKTYWALVERREGSPIPADEELWEDWVLKVAEQSRAEVVSADTPGARQAQTRVRCLDRQPEQLLLELRPHTGRMHQLRLQAAHRGWPVCGDVLYGSTRPFGPPAELPRDRIIALHARQLTFLHPIRYEPMTLIAPLPPVWSAGEIGS